MYVVCACLRVCLCAGGLRSGKQMPIPLRRKEQRTQAWVMCTCTLCVRACAYTLCAEGWQVGKADAHPPPKRRIKDPSLCVWMRAKGHKPACMRAHVQVGKADAHPPPKKRIKDTSLYACVHVDSHKYTCMFAHVQLGKADAHPSAKKRMRDTSLYMWMRSQGHKPICMRSHGSVSFSLVRVYQ